MQELTYLLALASVVVYGVFVVLPKTVNRVGYLLGDLFMGIILVCLLIQDRTSPVLVISLIWLVCNYVMRLSRKNPKWLAYDGFAAAAVLSHIRLPVWNLWI
jgi:hypothetical protein